MQYSLIYFPPPDAPVGDFDVGENICDRELVLLALRRLAFVWGERSDVDQSCYALILELCCSSFYDNSDYVRFATA
jgi:hypothetical protein